MQTQINSTGKVSETARRNSSTAQSDLDFFIPDFGTSSTAVDFIVSNNDSMILMDIKSGIQTLTCKAKTFLSQYKNNKQKKQAIEVLTEIENLFSGYEKVNAPELRIRVVNDGSLGLSWKIKDALFGVAIQKDPNESSWFLLQGDIEKGYKADGYLNELDYEIHLAPLMGIIRKS